VFEEIVYQPVKPTVPGCHPFRGSWTSRPCRFPFSPSCPNTDRPLRYEPAMQTQVQLNSLRPLSMLQYQQGVGSASLHVATVICVFKPTFFADWTARQQSMSSCWNKRWENGEHNERLQPVAPGAVCFCHFSFNIKKRFVVFISTGYLARTQQSRACQFRSDLQPQNKLRRKSLGQSSAELNIHAFDFSCRSIEEVPRTAAGNFAYGHWKVKSSQVGWYSPI